MSFRRVDLERGEPDEPQRRRARPRRALPREAHRAHGAVPARDRRSAGRRDGAAASRGRRFPPSGELRTSNAPIVHVTEPPLAGRPPGYAIGDVGAFSITAGVQPRKVDVGGSVAVTVRVDRHRPRARQPCASPSAAASSGSTPRRRSASRCRAARSWARARSATSCGSRTPARIDLGAVELPYWDPVQEEVPGREGALGRGRGRARRRLGRRGRRQAHRRAARRRCRLPRKELGAFQADARTARARGVALLGLVVGAAARPRAPRRGRARAARARAAPARGRRVAAHGGRARARAGERGRRPRATSRRPSSARSTRRSRRRSAVKSRGLLLGELGPALERAGASADDASRVAALLAACDGVRFVPGDAAADAGERCCARRRTTLVPALLRDAARSKRGGAA